MLFLKRFLAVTAGIAVFVLVMLLSAPVLNLMSHSFFKTTVFRDGQPPDRFVVALRDTAKPVGEGALSPASWKNVASLRASGKKFTFLLRGKEGEIPSEGDIYTYKVIEDRTTSQIIEVQFSNTHTSWSRYEAFDDRIVPIFYRTDGSILSLIPICGLLIAGFLLGRRVTKLVSARLAVWPPSASPD